MTKIAIYCCGCNGFVEARLTNGEEVYPHRENLYELPFWVCDSCRNYIGCHHKTKNRTRPLGVISTPELKKAKIAIHALLDPLWQNGQIARKELYRLLSTELGCEYHTGEIRTIEDARIVYRLLVNIKLELKAAQE